MCLVCVCLVCVCLVCDCVSIAVLFWLNYKAAYDNWNEQRLALNKDIHVATKEVVDKLPGIQQTSAQAFSTLFLQLTVNDLGICLPITNAAQVRAPPPRPAGTCASTFIHREPRTHQAYFTR